MSSHSNKQAKFLLSHQKLVIFLGAGGVGKTSCSIAWALHAANQGRRVALISIDPAKRMAAALGMKVGLSLTRLDFECQGQLHATMLDTKAVFDNMVKKHAPDEQTYQKILHHPLYVAASTQLAGPAEYMALALIQELVENPDFDHIVVDTPPDTQALEFLKRPNILAGFKENKVMYWLVKPFALASRFGMERLFSVGEKLMGGLTKVTGFQALKMVSEFLLLMQHVIDGFQGAGETIQRVLASEKTSFVLVGGSRKDSIRSAKVLCYELKEMGYTLDWLLLNKMLSNQIKVEVAQQQDHAESMLNRSFKSLVDRVTAEHDAFQVISQFTEKTCKMRLGIKLLPETSVGLIGKEDFINFAKNFELSASS